MTTSVKPIHGFTDEQCLTFSANLMENLAKDGWRIVE